MESSNDGVQWGSAPITVHPERIKRLQGTVAKGASDAEVLRLVELAARYDLDPLAGEVSLIRGRGKDGDPDGEPTLMVRRDGLRKVADRNGLRIDGDVVRQRDAFKVTRESDRSRSIEHTYTEAIPEGVGSDGDEVVESARGPIVGAWAECWEDESGKQRGFFFAPLSEYRPTDPKTLKETPWGTQESAMILSAAERQAVRQATPLSGMLVEGEMDRNHEVAAGMPADDPTAIPVVERAVREVVSEEWAERFIPLLLRVNELEPNTWMPSTIQMTLGKQSPDALEKVLADLEGNVASLEARAEPTEEQVERLKVLRVREGELEALATAAARADGDQDALAAYETELMCVREEIEGLGARPSNDTL
jgi:RecT family